MCQTCTDISIKCQCKYPVQSRTKLKEYRKLRILDIAPLVNALQNIKKFYSFKNVSRFSTPFLCYQYKKIKTIGEGEGWGSILTNLHRFR